ncbi:MAG: hypothetical protein HC792_00295 [Acaryochloridaceae cyanobacterium CSU_5_19]|nr:hypothetical protein [Acaryochloridaceae cyanobacterium CSU_5_19]
MKTSTTNPHNHTGKPSRQDIYTRVTGRIIADLERGFARLHEAEVELISRWIAEYSKMTRTAPRAAPISKPCKAYYPSRISTSSSNNN